MATVAALPLDFDELDDASLERLRDERVAANEALRRENALFEQFLRRQGASGGDDWSDGHVAAAPKRAQPPALSLDIKLEIASAEADAAKRETLAMRAAAEKAVAKLQVGTGPARGSESEECCRARTRSGHASNAAARPRQSLSPPPPPHCSRCSRKRTSASAI